MTTLDKTLTGNIVRVPRGDSLPTVRAFTTPLGATRFIVEYRQAGKRPRLRFKTLEAAEHARDVILEQMSAFGKVQVDRLVRTHLSEKQLRLAEDVFSRWPDIDLRASCGLWIASTLNRTFDPAEAKDSFLEDQRTRGVRQATLDGQKWTLDQLLRETDGNFRKIRTWLANPVWSIRTRRDRLDMVRHWLDWCVKTGRLSTNPLADLSRPRVPRKLPEILTVEHSLALLKAAAADEVEVERAKGNVSIKIRGAMLPWFATCMFSGLRPEEAQKLTWDCFNFEAKIVELRPEHTKVGRVRSVRLQDNLCTILEACKQRGLAPNFWSKRVFDRVRKAAGIPWSPDILRHTYVSMRFALDADLNEIARDCGNSVNILQQNYLRRTVTKADALRYRAIVELPTQSA